MRIIESILGLVGVVMAGIVYWLIVGTLLLANAVAGGLVALVGGWPRKRRSRTAWFQQ